MKIIVKTNASKNKVVGYDEERDAYRVEIKARPEKGEANLEIEKFLSKHFGKRVKIVSGFKSKLKVVKFLD